jgi:hypothetical protein
VTAASSSTARRSAFPAPFVAALLYALRVSLPPRRWVLLLVPCVAAITFGLLANVVEDQTAEGAFNTTSFGLFSLVLPLACLVVGDAVLGAEVRSGTIALTWLSPLPFVQLVVARWLAGWILASVALVPAMIAATIVGGVPDGAGAIALATVAGTSAYIALFVLVGAAVQRATLWSLAIVLLGERLLGTVLSGVAQLSPQWLARSVYGGLGPDADELIRSGVPSGGGAVVRLAIVTVVALAVASRRVAHLRAAGSPD